jgi:uncharacterized protein YutE (UPF0331/DUF86 family)
VRAVRIYRISTHSFKRYQDHRRYLALESEHYYQSFTALATIGMLDHAFAKRIAACAGLRNRITREYEAIDPARVHEALQSDVRDIPEYLKRLAAHVGL